MIADAISILSSIPGSLVYHLTLAMTLALLLGMARIHSPRSTAPPASQWTIAAGGLLTGRILFTFFAVLASLELISGDLLLPALDRYLSVTGLVVLMWAVFSTERHTRANQALLAMIVLTTLGLIGSILFQFLNLNELPFNLTLADALWGLGGMVISAIATIVLIVRRPTQWQLAFGAFCLLAIGHILHLTLGPKDGAFAGFVRLSELAAYPLLALSAVRTISLSVQQTRIDNLPAFQEPDAWADGSLALPLLEFAPFLDAATTEAAVNAVAQTLAHALPAELCMLLTPPDANGEFSIATGYDLIRESFIEGRATDSERCPVLASALNQLRTLTLPASSRSPDLDFLRKNLSLDSTGPVLLVPMSYDGDPLGGILLLSPFTQRTWTPEQQEVAQGIATALAKRIQQLNRLSSISAQEQTLEQIRAQLEASQQESEHLKKQMSLIQPSGKGDQPDNIADLLQLHDESQQTIRNLEAEIERLQSAVVDIPSSETSVEVERLTQELQYALQELSEARTSLSVMESESVPPPAGSAQAEPDLQIVASIAQELRQPMSSIMGYTDLLLSESVGLLGAMQRKFLERVRNGIERMGTLLNNMIQVTAIESGSLSLSPGPVDLLACIENAISQTSSILREKNLALRMDLPENLPHVLGDEDATTQIVTHLINNAVGASPDNEEIIIAARIQQAEGAEFLMLTFSDAGEGIPVKDLGRVFKSVYETDDIPIQGLGDSGMSLSIVHALVDAIGGRIWFDSKVGVGSTFTVLLPISSTIVSPAAEPENLR